jgi:DNA-binding response OmpR family regulator
MLAASAALPNYNQFLKADPDLIRISESDNVLATQSGQWRMVGLNRFLLPVQHKPFNPREFLHRLKTWYRNHYQPPAPSP